MDQFVEQKVMLTRGRGGRRRERERERGREREHRIRFELLSKHLHLVAHGVVPGVSES